MSIFHLGSLINVEKIFYRNVVVQDDYVEFNVSTFDSALSYSRNVNRIEGSNLYINVYHALASRWRSNRGIVRIDVDTKDINEIYIEDDTNNILIWKR